MHLHLLFICISLLWSPLGFAEDDEWLDDEESEEKEEERIENSAEEGDDSSEIYRAQLKANEKLSPEEEIFAWKNYLKQYPQTSFRVRIETRMEELEAELYDGDLEGGGLKKEAGRQEIKFAQPLLLENIDPRTKLRFAFEMGLPNYINLLVDYEHQLYRELSVHGGVRKRYTGWSVEGGAHYALVKSSRLDALVTAIADVHINTDPMFIGIRPQIAAGKRFKFANGTFLDAQAQLGTDLEFFNGEKAIQPVLLGGAHMTYVPNKTIRIYVEANMFMKEFFWDGSAFAFNTVTFGMKFLDAKKGREGNYDAGVGTTVPFYYKYWRYHYGSITGDLNLFYD